MKGVGNPHHFIAGGQGALPQDANGRPWTGDNVFASGDLVEDLTHNFFLETGARNNKLKVYEMVEHPAARALTGYLLVRGGVHQIAYARAIEHLTGAQLMKMFPTPRIPTDAIPECKPHIARGDHLRLYRFSPNDYQELAAVFNGPNPETGEDLIVFDEAPEGEKGVWRVRQIIADPAGDHDWGITADVLLDDSAREGVAVVRVTAVGPLGSV